MFNEVLSMIEVGDPSEEILRELINNVNMKLITILKLLKESQSNPKPILKQYNISKEYYNNVLSKLVLDKLKSWIIFKVLWTYQRLSLTEIRERIHEENPC